MILSLIGFMGSGKSSVARELAALLCCSYIDLDKYIETAERKAIVDIFRDYGEKTFREMEVKYLKEVLEKSPQDLILSLGGGTVINTGCKELTIVKTRPVYLQAEIDTLLRNLENQIESRPMLKGEKGLKARIIELMEEREEIYKECAEFIIKTDGLTPKEIAVKIREELK